MTNKTYYYVTGNTAEGYVNFITSNIENIEQIIVLKHPSHTLKTSIISHIIERYEATYDLEILLSSLGHRYLEGVIIREKSIAVLVDTVSAPIESERTEIDLKEFVKVNASREETNLWENNNQKLTDTAYQNFAAGLKIHDSLESIFINQMNFEKADEVAHAFIENVLKDVEKQNRPSHVYHRLFGTNTVDGVVNVVPEILATLSKSYFIKGRAGTGKSTFMKKVLKACQAHGLDIELYHCSFDPNSIDMVLVRELGFCIFDSTDPHEFSPKRAGEEVIDMYEKTVAPGTDERFKEQIEKVNQNYKAYMKKGIALLKEAGSYLEHLENEYTISEEKLNEAIKQVNHHL